MEPDDRDLEQRLNRWANLQGEPEVSPEARERILRDLQGSLQPVKPLPPRPVLVLQLTLAFLLLAAILTAALKFSGIPVMTDAPVNLLAALFTAAGVLFSLLLAAQMIPGSRAVLPLAPALALSTVGMVAGFALAFPWQSSSHFIDEGWRCAVMELAFVAFASIVFWGFARRGALFPSAPLGVILAALSACLALVPLQFQCMFQQAPHLLVWHGGAAIVLVLAGAGWGVSRAKAA